MVKRVLDGEINIHSNKIELREKIITVSLEI